MSYITLSNPLVRVVYKQEKTVEETSWVMKILLNAVCCIMASSREGGQNTNLVRTAGWVFTCEWPKEGNDDAAQKAVDIMTENVQSLAKARNLLLNFKCMSFASGCQKVLGSYGAENIKAMQEVAINYDPEGVFQKQQYGGFLLRDIV